MRTSKSAAAIQSSVEDEELIQKRRKQFCDAAADLFARKGYHSTTIKEIAEQAGVSIGLIYLYIKTKEDVLFLVIESVLNSYITEIPKAMDSLEDPIERFCAAVTAYCKVVGVNPEATLLAYRETGSLSSGYKNTIKLMELETNQLITKCIQDCIDKGYFRQINVELFTYQIVFFAHGWALKSWRLKQLSSLDIYISSGLDVFLNGVLTQLGWSRFKQLFAESTIDNI